MARLNPDTLWNDSVTAPEMTPQGASYPVNNTVPFMEKCPKCGYCPHCGQAPNPMMGGVEAPPPPPMQAFWNGRPIQASAEPQVMTSAPLQQQQSDEIRYQPFLMDINGI